MFRPSESHNSAASPLELESTIPAADLYSFDLVDLPDPVLLGRYPSPLTGQAQFESVLVLEDRSGFHSCLCTGTKDARFLVVPVEMDLAIFNEGQAVDAIAKLAWNAEE